MKTRLTVLLTLCVGCSFGKVRAIEPQAAPSADGRLKCTSSTKYAASDRIFSVLSAAAAGGAFYRASQVPSCSTNQSTELGRGINDLTCGIPAASTKGLYVLGGIAAGISSLVFLSSSQYGRVESEKCQDAYRDLGLEPPKEDDGQLGPWATSGDE